jgi:hypothetical protein
LGKPLLQSRFETVPDGSCRSPAIPHLHVTATTEFLRAFAIISARQQPSTMSLAQLSRLLPLPEDELKQILEYGATLSKPAAAEHFGNLLGDGPAAVEFIATFNARRHDPTPTASSQSNRSFAAATGSTPGSAPSSNPPSDIDAVPKIQRKGKKKSSAPLHALAPRKVESLGPAPGAAYTKKDAEDDYMAGRSGTSTPANKFGPTNGTMAPPPVETSSSAAPKPTRTAGGYLISEMMSGKARSNPGSRSSTPGPTPKQAASASAMTKVSITGGTAMQGASTALSDLDAAIRALELTTNPNKTASASTAEATAARRCNCVATRHPLQAAAPNCLNCGKVVCLKEGLGPCTFCGTPLLSREETQVLLKELKAERGREKMAADRDSHRRADVGGTPRAFTQPRQSNSTASQGGAIHIAALEAEQRAREHRDRLLAFQAQNARRTTVRDEAADFDLPTNGGSMWSTPEERAQELKRQQKVMREMEWNARPEYEKRRQVVSLDLVNGKVVKRMAAIEKPKLEEEEPDDDGEWKGSALAETSGNREAGGGGAFSHNPLLGGLIKPVFDAKGKGTELEGRKAGQTTWRRVQDDLDDNEAIILDGGKYGDAVVIGGKDGADAHDEPACG